MKYVIPVAIFLIIVNALKNKVPVYDTFCDGVQWGMKTVLGIFPVIAAITMAVGMMRASGLMELMTGLVSPVTDIFHLPKEVLPLALIRPVSGGGALGVLSDILKEYHPDSAIGIVASVIMGSTETTFYTLMVYFKNTRVKHVGRIIPVAVVGDIVGIVVAAIVCFIIFK